MLRAALAATELAACRGAAARGDPGAGSAHGDQHTPDRRALPRAAGRQLPPHSQSRRLERAGGRVLLGLLLDTFVPAGPVLLGLDDTIEHQRGKRISAKGIYRDPVRSSHGHFVKASGLRWLSLMLLVVGPLCGPTSMGRAGLGAAVPDGARPLGAVLPRARAALQEADRLGAAVGPAGPPLD